MASGQYETVMMEMKPKRTRILAHGRSGTLYMAKVLRAAGLDFGHEKDGPDGAIGAILWDRKEQEDFASRCDCFIYNLQTLKFP